ncbi:hypothetical protein GIB67_004863 [Kingdonia uniflora]|uniref:Protein kinase domain-containing protein n=1 Tax=Kingdonia uniflora TaxID=39325 RepID=A0A7J7LNS2_9MAGN|nr:hypothetical protein GIB67_004863 [Kingdonia uniflora]
MVRGITTSLLFSAFDSWLVAERNKVKYLALPLNERLALPLNECFPVMIPLIFNLFLHRGFEQQWLSVTFSKAILVIADGQGTYSHVYKALQNLDHPNVVKSYMQQLLLDFGLANYFNPNHKRPLTSKVVPHWYRAPELLLGATYYGVGIDLWSAGCLMAEMFAARPIMPGRTEVEQLHRIFKLCGSPSEDYWKRLKLPASFQPPQPYKPSLSEAFRDFPSSSFGLLTTLLALDPSYGGTASSALRNEISLPVIYKEEEKPDHTSDRKKQRSSKLKQRSRTHKKNDSETEKSKGNSGSSKELLKILASCSVAEGFEVLD